MKMYISRVLYGLGIFTFFFYFTKVSSVPNVPTIESIIDVMKHDTELCTPPTFLYENNVTKQCLSVTYPEKNLTPTCESMNTFLCLAFYDTLYKVCQFKEIQMPFNNVTTFYSYIQKFFPEETETAQAKFCENIKNITFSYEKIKPLLSSIHLNNSHVCYLACYNLNEKFIPLCAILSWSKSIDDMKERNKNEHTDLFDSTSSTKVAISLQETKHINSDVKEDKVNRSSNGYKLKDTQNEASTNKNLIGMSSLDQVTENRDTPLVTKSKDTNLNQPSTINDSLALNQHKEAGLDKPDEKPEDSKKLVNHNANALNNDMLWNTDDPNEDLKANTISEDTQDHENSVNQNDKNHVEEEKLSNNANDGPYLLIETDDRVQSIPDPSEQRVTSHYHKEDSYHKEESEEDSHFFTYFTVVSIIFIAAYIGYHNKQKILAILLEGRRSRNSRSRRRPSTASYRKLNCTLEEAVTSQCNANVTHVLY